MDLERFLHYLNFDFMTKKTILVLGLILILSALMRFYNLYSFGYFTGDEEILHSMVRKVTVDRKPPLVIPNAQIGGSMGSFFVLLIAPLFALADNDPLTVQVIGSVIGLLTTLAIFWVGTLTNGQMMGFLAGVLYGGSFMVALFDRRLWTLTLDPLMITLSIGALIEIIQKKYQYSLLLAVAVSFTWHSDPAIAVALVASVLSFLIYRISIWRKEFAPAGFYLLLSVLPFIIFELRHPGTVFRPWLIHLTGRSVVDTSLLDRLTSINIITTLQNLSRSLFSSPTSFIEQYYCYCSKYPAPFFSPIPEILTAFILIFCMVWVLKTKDKLIKDNLKILLIFLFAFLLGIIIYTSTLSYAVYQHYFVTVFPVFLLLSAFALNKIAEKLPLAVGAFLTIFIAVNLWTLFNSTLRFSLWEKIELVKQTIPQLKGSSFSVYGTGDHSLFDGGWVLLFINSGLHPNRSYLNGGWDFIYRTHSLYSYNPDQKEGEKIVIFHDVKDYRFKNNPLFYKKKEQEIAVGNMAAVILDNKESWFHINLLK